MFICTYWGLINLLYILCYVINVVLILCLPDRKADGRSRVDREADNQQLLQLEEKDIVSSVATVLSDLCGPGEWMPMEKLHSEVTSSSINIKRTAPLNSFIQ